MSDHQLDWLRRYASAGIVAPGDYGVRSPVPAVRVKRRDGLGLAIVICHRRQEAALASALRDAMGAQLPTMRKFATGRDGAILWSAPEQWLVVLDQPNAVSTLTLKLAGLAAVIDQSDALTHLRLSGARIRDVLAKGCGIDLHPRAFGAGDVALTSISHVGIQLWQLDDTPTYELTVPRSMTASFWSWFDSSAAEFGYSVD